MSKRINVTPHKPPPVLADVPKVDKMPWWQNRYLIKTRVKQFVFFVLDAAPIVANLRKDTHPIAWAAAAAHFLGKVTGFERGTKRTRTWRNTSYETDRLVIQLLIRQGAGIILESGDHEIRLLGATRFGFDGEDTIGPWGPPDDRTLMDWIWEHVGALQITSKTTYRGNDNISLDADVDRNILNPPLRICAIADECMKMKKAGHKIGLLLDGPPGSGKSQALLYIAQALGGKSIRACMSKIEPHTLVDLAILMRPDAVIFDDIDRTKTDMMLDAVDVITQAGIAVLASSNEASKLCDAMVRSGRIDDRHFLGAVEPDILDRVGDRLSEEERETLQHYTVATLMRYLERRDTLGHDKAQRGLKRAKKVLVRTQDTEDEE